MINSLTATVVILGALLQETGPLVEAANAPQAERENVRTVVPDSIHSMALRDIRSEAVNLPSRSDPAAIDDWRRKSLQRIWTRMNPGARPLRDDQLSDLMLRDLDDLRAEFPESFLGESASILLGEPSVSLTPVGMLLLKGPETSNFFPQCSVILTRFDTVITARHCFDHAAAESAWKVYFPFEGTRDVRAEGISFFCEEGTGTCSPDIDDLAAIKVQVPFRLIPPAGVGSAGDATTGTEATIWGFGVDAIGDQSMGLLLMGEVSLKPCEPCGAGLLDSGRQFCFDFKTSTEGLGRGGAHGNLGGDSGGPMAVGASWFDNVIGVSSENDSCGTVGQREGRYVNLTHSKYQAWTQNVMCSPLCASSSSDIFDELIEPVSTAYVEDLDENGQVLPDKYEFVVKERSKMLIVTLNHETLGFDDPPEPWGDLELVLPDGIAAQGLCTDSSCCERYWGVEVCSIEAPASGTFELAVDRVKGNPAYQLTVSAIRCPTNDQQCWDAFLSQRL